MKATSRQMNVIKIIEHNLNIKFKGATKTEASSFISEYIEESKKEAQLSRRMDFEDEANSFGLPNQ